MSAYSVYAKHADGKFVHIGDDTRIDIVEAAVRVIRRQGYQAFVTITRLR